MCIHVIYIYMYTCICMHIHTYTSVGLPGMLQQHPWKQSGWVAVKELHLNRTRFPLKGSFTGDVDIDINSYHSRDM